MARSHKFQFPMQGFNENFAATTQPRFTSASLNNVRPYDVLENRARGGQRPGLKPLYQQILGYHYVDPDSIIALWHMDEYSVAADGTIDDQTGLYDLTEAASEAMTSENSPFGGALKFDGDSEYLKSSAADSGSITAFADGTGGGDGDVVTVTSTAHGLSTGQYVTISGTTNYNGIYEITKVDADSFKIDATWVSDDGTGSWFDSTLHQVGDLTIAAWIKPANVTGTKRIVSLYDDTNDYVQYELWLDGSTLKGTVGTDESTYTAYTATKSGVTAAQWQLVVMTVSGTTVQVYLNGTAGTSATTAGTRIQAPSTDLLHIGARFDTAAEGFFNGSICNVMIYDDNLSASQITALMYDGGLPIVDMTQIDFVDNS